MSLGRRAYLTASALLCPPALQFRNRIGQALVVLFGFAGTTWVASNTLLSEAGSLAARLQPYWHYLAGYVAIASVLTFAYLYIKVGCAPLPSTRSLVYVPCAHLPERDFSPP